MFLMGALVFKIGIGAFDFMRTPGPSVGLVCGLTVMLQAALFKAGV
jgi:hypothetical protein